MRKTFEQVFEEALVNAYISEYGEGAWASKTDKEKSETLHELLGSFLAVARMKNAGAAM